MLRLLNAFSRNLLQRNAFLLYKEVYFTASIIYSRSEEHINLAKIPLHRNQYFLYDGELRINEVVIRLSRSWLKINRKKREERIRWCDGEKFSNACAHVGVHLVDNISRTFRWNLLSGYIRVSVMKIHEQGKYSTFSWTLIWDRRYNLHR